jgi:hypothetical protein
MYTVKNFKSKKELKEAVAAYNLAIEARDQGALILGAEIKPLPLAVRYFQPGPFGGNEPVNGTFCCEGPHYPQPHKWYATCTAKDGVIVKVS